MQYPYKKSMLFAVIKQKYLILFAGVKQNCRSLLFDNLFEISFSLYDHIYVLFLLQCHTFRLQPFQVIQLVKIPPKNSLYIESADNQAGTKQKNSTKSVIYLLSSEKHIIFALQKRSNSTTIFVVRHLRLRLLKENNTQKLTLTEKGCHFLGDDAYMCHLSLFITIFTYFFCDNVTFFVYSSFKLFSFKPAEDN